MALLGKFSHMDPGPGLKIHFTRKIIQAFFRVEWGGVTLRKEVSVQQCIRTCQPIETFISRDRDHFNMLNAPLKAFLFYLASCQLS